MVAIDDIMNYNPTCPHCHDDFKEPHQCNPLIVLDVIKWYRRHALPSLNQARSILARARRDFDNYVPEDRTTRALLKQTMQAADLIAEAEEKLAP